MSPASPSGRNRIFYGWPLAGAVWFLYGLQVAGFYSWGFYLPEMLRDLDMSRAAGGMVFGVQSFCGGAASPFVGMAITRFGLRRVMTLGFGVSALGYFATSTADGFWQLVVFFGIFTASTHAFATVIPTQTLASIWFRKYRARMMAFLLAAGGVCAPVILMLNAQLLQVSTWRTGWVLIGCLNLALAVLAFAMVRDSPESIGQCPDGASAQDVAEHDETASPTREPFTAAQALRTPQFRLMVLSGLGYAVPWAVLVNHGRLHLQDLGFDIRAAAAILSAMALVSTFGRLSGALGDFLSPPRLLGVALTLEGLGAALFLIATTPARAYAAVILVGLGFGLAFICQAATFASFFGRKAFATTTGVRFFVGAVFAAGAPAVTGWYYDVDGSYAVPFLGLTALSLVGAIVAFTIRSPEPPLPTVESS
ncbi:MAG: MFS transporter [Acidobacteriota bacterium]|nr:MFS transporter [Acidobacteriota bacterium]